MRSFQTSTQQICQHVMMMGYFWLQGALTCLVLLTVTGALWNLPFVTAETCDPSIKIRPVVNISSSPSTKCSPIGVNLTLNCIAKPRETDSVFLDRWVEYIEWHDPQGRHVGAKCLQPSDIHSQKQKLSCPLVLKNLTVDKSGSYTCQAGNGYEKHCTRKSIWIDVQKPEIIESPESQSVSIGSNATFSCTARGFPTIHWIKDNAPYPLKSNSRASVIPDNRTNRSQLFITRVEMKDNGKYQCIANNSCGRDQSGVAFLKIGVQKPEIAKGPESQSISIGSNATLNCTARGLPRPTIIWIKDNASYPLRPNSKASVIQDNGEISSQLLITGVETEDYGKYQCVANNSFGKSQPGVAFLKKVAQKPEIIEGPENQSVSIGSNATFSCTARGLPRPTILWKKDNASYPLQSNSKASVIQDNQTNRSQLFITGLEMEDYGKYQCIATNSVGRSQSGVAVLSKVNPTLIPTTSKNEKPENSASHTTTIAVSCTLVPSLICLVTGFVWIRRRNRDKKDRKRVTEVYLDKGKHLPNGIEDLENDWSPNTQTIKNLEERRPLVWDGVRERGSPDGSEQDDTMQQVIEERDQERLDSGEKTGTDIFTTDKCVDLVVDDQRQISSQETEEGCENLENLEVFDEILGEGEFGIVYKGRYGGKDGNMTDVAVKKLKDLSAIAKETLLNEIRTLKLAGKHPNIVTLIGTRIEEGNVLVVTELIHGGSLENILKAKRAPGENNNYHNVCCKLNDRQLVTIAFQIAAGMQHLEERKFVHRDLAARNILVDTNLVAKVGDFGLARDISDAGIYTITSNGKVPWRWSSLESLRDLHFTSMSDVWSFGIVLWEIATYGELPYPDISSPITLASRLATGYRMPRPDQCSEELYELMSSCWKENPMMRPAFSQIAQQLKNFLREVKRTYMNITEENDGEA